MLMTGGPSDTTAIVIDDDPDVAAVFTEYLMMNGIDVLGKGHNGKVAIELYQKFRPDIVFLDLMMSEYDGFYGLQNIKQLDPLAKIVMVTADPTEESSQKMKKLGADMIIYKPFEIDEILSAINRLSKYEVVRQ